MGGLTLREALSSQFTVLLKQIGPFEPTSAGLAIIVALGLELHYGSHGNLLGLAFVF